MTEAQNLIDRINFTAEEIKMSKETAKKLIAEMQTNEELKAKTAGITDKDALVKMAVEAG